MKIRIADRVLVALAGVLLLALCAGVIAQSFFGVPVLKTVEGLFEGKTAIVWLPYVLCAVLLVLGVYCIALLFRRRKGKRGFVMQETDGGELSIALTAMDGLVAQCVAVHDEIQLLASNITTDHDGVMVELRVAFASGVSLPLAVDALQKQIRQYVTSCSGVEVREVRVQVDAMDSQPVDTPYAVPAMLQSAMPAPLLARGAEDSEEKPLHQRIFSDNTETAAPAQTEPEKESAEQANEQPEEPVMAESEAEPEPVAAEEPVTEPAENTEDSEVTESEQNDDAADDADTEIDVPEEETAPQSEEETDETAE